MTNHTSIPYVLPIKRSVTEERNFTYINSNGVEFLDYVQVNSGCNYEKGYRTITDFITMVRSSDNPPAITDFVYRVNTIMGYLERQVDIGKTLIENNYVTPKNFNVQNVFDLLIDEGFVCTTRFFHKIIYVKFNDKNLPFMYVTVKDNESTAEARISSFVDKILHDKIFLSIEPQLIKQEKRIKVTQLDNYYKDKNTVTPSIKQYILTEKMDYGFPEFYPWIKMDLKKYFKEFMESRASVLVLTGAPGTGKTTFIRTLLRELELNAFIAFKTDIISSPEFIGICQKFIEDDLNRKSNEKIAQIIVVEDADIIMGKRSSGNIRMAEILNATSGIVSDENAKFILSTNIQDINEIDSALLRPGRCFDVLCFRELTHDEAVNVRRVKGLPITEIDKHRKYKLSEILNDVITEEQIERIVQPRFGFGI